MTNNISINQQNQTLHPITAKLLNDELKLSNITLEQFREGRTVYDSYKEAQLKGYEAHHITPRSCQKELTDDRCIRYTPFEHIIDHYLMAKENERYVTIFENMVQFNFCNLINNEKDLLNKCIEFAKLREKGKIITSKKLKENSIFKNTHYYNNGIIEVRQTTCPDGFIKGRLPEKATSKGSTGMHWYTNGNISVMSLVCPDGWKPGIGNETLKNRHSQKGVKRSEIAKQHMRHPKSEEGRKHIAEMDRHKCNEIAKQNRKLEAEWWKIIKNSNYNIHYFDFRKLTNNEKKALVKSLEQ